ncbi:FG-GAP and VCBS repeat-containing protein [Streptomyces sp. YS415]|uniref:FG-GAP and VCBS repeat-containing protein n=1 Tax=Streptomyces sp. YS415 TaxID=2944806 RepID=UPI0020201A35|nr:FG-GAP and VCBS repeat-containing protein [Streptomyces sp. YS415]MCL7428858.1 VCBS repeat-containing protein [Streptomyces sp. YS415]
MSRRTAAALAAALLATGVTPLFLTAPATAAVAKHYDDFNGDGHRDVAYGGYNAVGQSGGTVTVVYGTASGLDTAHPKAIHQDTAGIPGTDEEDDQFGASLASADLNKDGYADLIVGNPTEHVGSQQYRGAVTVVWGSASGLSGGTNLALKSGAQGHFGRDLATGDFNGDGSPDLAVVGGGETWLYRGGFTKSGTTGAVSEIDKEGAGWYSYSLAAGKVNGDGRTDLVVLGEQFVDGQPVERAWYLKGASGGLTSGPSKTVTATTAAIGDFDKNGYGDIAFGRPDSHDGKGSVLVWRGASAGPSGSAMYNQASSGVSGSAEAGDNFGYALSAGDVNGDGYADLAVGVPHEDVSGKEDQGGVTLFRGGSGGLDGMRSAWIPQTVTGPAESHSAFGYTLRLRDLTKDGKADLGIGAAGTALVLRGATGTPTATGAFVLPELGGTFAD